MADNEAIEDAEMQERIERYEKAQAWFDEKWARPHYCPICQTDEWIIGGMVDLPFWTPERSLAYASKAYPSFLAVCANCGYTMLFNAVVAGIVPKMEDDTSDTDVSE